VRDLIAHPAAYRFRGGHMLLTNSTCPPSTLLMLIAGLERIKAAYAHRPPGTASPTATTAEMPRRGRRHRFKAALALIIGSAA